MKLNEVKKILALASATTMLSGCAFNPATNMTMEVYGPAPFTPEDEMVMVVYGVETPKDIKNNEAQSIARNSEINTELTEFVAESESRIYVYGPAPENTKETMINDSENKNVKEVKVVQEEIELEPFIAEHETQVCVYGPAPAQLIEYNPEEQKSIAVYGVPIVK